MEYRFPKENGLTVLWFAASCTLVFCMGTIYLLLLQMERGYLLTLSNKLELQVVDDDETAADTSENNNNSNNKKETKQGEKKEEEEEEVIRVRLTKTRKFVLAVIVGILTLLLYLLLVRSNASAVLSWVGFGAFFFVLFSNHIGEEVRRRRPDRFAAIVSMMLLMAMALHLIVYAAEQVADGQIHEGKARIIGYDSSQYDDTKSKDTITRTDLWVSWGGSWGCPSHPNTYCEAAVQGALCESESKDEDQNKRGRFLADSNNADNSSSSNNGAATSSNNSDSAQQDEDALEEEVKEEQAKNEELEQEVKDEKAENEQLKEEEGELEEYTEVLEDCLEDYMYGDDYFYDEYWADMDWDSVWGDYACEELFSEELGSDTGYDPDSPPGDDDWPFVNIYGNCKTCEAYIVDYFSTENFQKVQEYKISARNYGMATAVSLVIAALLALKQRLMPTTDNEIELLSRHGSSPFHGTFA